MLIHVPTKKSKLFEDQFKLFFKFHRILLGNSVFYFTFKETCAYKGIESYLIFKSRTRVVHSSYYERVHILETVCMNEPQTLSLS
jgi:hypothetical protein